MITRHITTNKKKFEWIDVINPSAEELKEIAEQYSLHNTSVQDCLQPEHLPKFERIDDVVFIITRVFDETSSKNADTIQDLSNKTAIFVGPKFIITIHRLEQHFLGSIRTKFVEPHLCSSPNDVLVKILYAVLQSYEPAALSLENELDAYETQIFLRKHTNDILKKLYHLKRKASVCLRILKLSKNILDNLNTMVSAPVLQDLRELYVSLETSFEQTIENTNNLLNLYISLSSQRTNEVMRVLTVFAVFFMPLTFIVGIYGMNFDIMPELRHPLGYPAVMLVMGTITLGIYLWFKRKGWL